MEINNFNLTNMPRQKKYQKVQGKFKRVRPRAEIDLTKEQLLKKQRELEQSVVIYTEKLENIKADLQEINDLLK